MVDTLTDLFTGVLHLLALCTVHWIVVRNWPPATPAAQTLAGFAFGAIVVIGMATPVALAPGIIFDGRTVVISNAALIGGLPVAAIAAAMGAAMRLAIGGIGTPLGVTEILIAVAIGLGFRFWAWRRRRRPRLKDAIAMGLVTQTAILPIYNFLPEPFDAQAYAQVALPAFAIFTVATPVLGGLLLAIERSVEAERMLADREARLQATLTTLPDLLFLLDEHGRCQEVHGSRLALSDRWHNPIIGATLTDPDMPLEPERWAEAIAGTLSDGVLREFTFSLDRNGPEEPRYLQARIAPLAGGGTDGGQRLVAALVRDVTAFVASEREALAARDAAERANRAKSEFLAHMSHDLRTPLNAIMGFAQAMRMEVLGPIGNGQYLTYVDSIHLSGELLVSLINDVLDVAKIEAGQYRIDPHPHEPRDIAQTSIRLLRQQAETKSQSLGIELADTGYSLLVDRRAVLQVLNNIISNAVKFTPIGGRITVSTRLCDDGWYELAVSDTGVGMTDQAIADAPIPFRKHHSTQSRQDHGSGLGLYIAHRLMALHDGTLAITSVIGDGTRVALRFPPTRVRQPSAEPPAQASGFQAATRGRPAGAAAGTSRAAAVEG